MKSFEPAVDVVVGALWGDESKALVVARKAARGEYDYVARTNGSDNAGGKVITADGSEFTFNQLGAGHPYGVPTIIGKGVLLNTASLHQEIVAKRELGLSIDEDTLFVSDLAKVTLPQYVYADQKAESGEMKQGSTQKGVRQAAEAFYGRRALTTEMIAKDLKGAEKLVLEGIYRALSGGRFNFDQRVRAQREAQEWAEQTREILPYITDTDKFVQDELAQGKRILAEGAQSLALSIESRGYPLVTSSHAGPAGVPLGLGCNVKQLGDLIAVTKATPTRVGEGEFPTEILDEELAQTLRGPEEYGNVTGRPRRVGYPNFVMQHELFILHGISKIVLPKLDCVPRYGSEVYIATSVADNGNLQYERFPTWEEDISDIKDISDLPKAAQDHIDLYRDYFDVEVESVSVGRRVDQAIYL